MSKKPRNRNTPAKYRRLALGLLPGLLLWSSCSFRLAPELPAATAGAEYLCGQPATDGEFLFVVPREFREFNFVAHIRNRVIEYGFGAAARGPMRDLLNSCFANARIEEISDDRISMPDALHRYARSQRFDYIAVVRFARASMRGTRTRVDVELSIEVEFLSRDTSKDFAVGGEGMGRTRFYLSAPLEAAGRDALARALASLRAELERWRELLVPTSRSYRRSIVAQQRGELPIGGDLPPARRAPLKRPPAFADAYRGSHEEVSGGDEPAGTRPDRNGSAYRDVHRGRAKPAAG